MSTLTTPLTTTDVAAGSPAAVPGPRFGDPGPLGLAAFALTTFVLSFANAGWIASGGVVVLGLALFYGGIGQVIAGVWEFANKNTFGATAFTSYGLFWMSTWFLLTSGNKFDSAGLGLYFLIWGIFTLYMFVASIKTNLVLILVFAALTLTFIVLAIGEFANSESVSHLGGYLGVLTAILAFYGSFAGVTNSTFKRAVLPVWAAK
jgi:uncharacterized protein